MAEQILPTSRNTTTYKLSAEARLAILKQAPSWRTGRGAPDISMAEIERQRKSFINRNGFDGLKPIPDWFVEHERTQLKGSK